MKDAAHPAASVDQLGRLQDLANALGRSLTTLDVGKAVVGTGVQAARALSGSVFLLEDGLLSRVYGSGFPPDCSLPVLRFPLTAPLPVAKAATRGELVVVSTRTQFEAEFPELAARLADHQGFVGLPLRFGDRVTGGIALGFAGPLSLDERERGFLEALAAQCAQAFERARLLEAEQSARATAEAEAKAKDRFLAMLGHELRNPLAAMVSALELAARAEVSPLQHERFTGVVERQVTLLKRMVDDLLDASRISQGKIQLLHETFPLDELVHQTLQDLDGAAAAAGVRLRFEPPQVPVTLQADRTRISQTLGNLLTNAIKFSHPGGEVVVSLHDEGTQARLEVRDEGVGISPELLPRLFQPFVQADTSLDRKRGGLGLGLAVSRGWMELHGGKLTARSAGLGRGTTFELTLPCAPTASMSTPPSPLPPSREASSPTASKEARRILLVEDNADVAEMLAELLSLEGYTVTVAGDGREGLRVAGELRPDIVVCDLGLPLMSGYELAKALKSSEATREAYLIALSGYGQESDRTRSSSSGFDLHLTKPVDMHRLRAALAMPGTKAADAKRSQS